MKRFIALASVILFAVAPTVQVFANEVSSQESTTSPNGAALAALTNGQLLQSVVSAEQTQPLRVDVAWCFPCYQIYIPPCPSYLPICRPPV